jgi:hypothetical protein
MPFFSTKCALILLKIENDFNIDNLKGKRIWIDKFCFWIDLNTFESKILLTLKVWIEKICF